MLQPSSLVSAGEWWGTPGKPGVFPTLQLALRTAAMRVLPPDRSCFYEISVTQEEVFRGCLALPPAERNRKTFIYRRKVVGDRSALTRNFIDFDGAVVDQDAQQRLELLRDQTVVENLPPSRVKLIEIPSETGNRFTEITPVSHSSYLKTFLDDFCELAMDDIERISRDKARLPDPVLDETLHHLGFMHHRIESFSLLDSHKVVIDRVSAYIQQEAKHPFVVQGESGSGKSSLMAYLVKKTESIIERGTIIQRYLGTTADSSTARLLLQSLCAQLARVYGSALVPSSDYTTLQKEFGNFLSLATAERPLYLFLDSLDQLSDENNGRRLDWLPFTLPANVHLVVSTLPNEGPSYAVLQAKLGPDRSEVEVCALQPQDGSRMLNAWLEAAKRQFTEPQRSLIEQRFLECPSPLWLKIVLTSSAAEWRSYTTEIHLANSIIHLLEEMFQKLATIHGEALVSRALGLISASKNGLATTELLDILALDEEVLDSVFQWWTPPTRRLPPLCWTRLETDLGHMLQRRGADGSVPVWCWFHRQCIEVARKLFLNKEQAKICRGLLVSYFSSQWAGKAKPYGKNQSADRAIAPQELYLSPGVPNLRRLSELPHALLGLEDWEGAEKAICNLDFVEAMCKAGF